MPRSRVIGTELDHNSLEFIRLVAQDVFDKPHRHVGREDAVKPRGHHRVSRKNQLRPRNVQDLGMADVSGDTDQSPRLSMSPHAHAPLGFRVGETQHQTLVRGGVHHAACCKSNRQHTCTGTKPFASARIHHHPRRPRPSWTPQHLGVPRLPGGGTVFFQRFEFRPEACVFEHHKPVGLREVGPVLGVPNRIEPRA